MHNKYRPRREELIKPNSASSSSISSSSSSIHIWSQWRSKLESTYGWLYVIMHIAWGAYIHIHDPHPLNYMHLIQFHSIWGGPKKKGNFQLFYDAFLLLVFLKYACQFIGVRKCGSHFLHSWEQLRIKRAAALKHRHDGIISTIINMFYI